MVDRVGSVGEVVGGEQANGTTGPARPVALRPRTCRPVGLDELFPGSGVDLEVSGITLDTRLVNPGDLFVGLPGRHHHGAEFAAVAARAGAVAVLTDPAGLGSADGAIPVVVVPDPRHAMAWAAAAIYGEPARAMTMYAVTGTNGKTTTTFLLDAALRAAGVRTGVVGTIGFRLDGRELAGARTTITTPESPELQALLGRLRDEGAQSVVMEVSSHALVLGRADAIVFDVAAFTNLGRDHLDFHGDLESYFEAKAALFTAERTRRAVLNVDDPRGAVLAERLRRSGDVPVTTVGLSPTADVHAIEIGPVEGGRTRLRARVLGQEVDVRLGLPGEFNVRNALSALAMVAVTGGDLEAAAVGLGDAEVPGRMQRVDLGAEGPVVFVDFAHTPQAVSAALAAAAGSRTTSAGRLVAVLGSGGDRDPDKRESMGAAAVAVADVVVVTDDNPRTEDPATIRARVLDGARSAAREGSRTVEVVDGGDRRHAIAWALATSRPGDVVAVLGKGHESGQEIAGRVLPFADPDVVRDEWASARGTS